MNFQLPECGINSLFATLVTRSLLEKLLNFSYLELFVSRLPVYRYLLNGSQDWLN